MKFCQEHWDALRAAIVERGLSHLIAPDGKTAAAQMADQLQRAAAGEEPGTAVNYDPLMAAHWAIASNAMSTLECQRGSGQPSSAFYLMAGPDVPEDPVEGYGEAYEGRTWPRCPLCYLNLAHEVSCSHEGCDLDRERGFDWMITRAADDQAEHVKGMES